jgi:hypothetical protein
VSDNFPRHVTSAPAISFLRGRNFEPIRKTRKRRHAFPGANRGFADQVQIPCPLCNSQVDQRAAQRVSRFAPALFHGVNLAEPWSCLSLHKTDPSPREIV